MHQCLRCNLTDNKAGAWGALKPAMHPSAEMYPPAQQETHLCTDVSCVATAKCLSWDKVGTYQP